MALSDAFEVALSDAGALFGAALFCVAGAALGVRLLLRGRCSTLSISFCMAGAALEASQLRIAGHFFKAQTIHTPSTLHLQTHHHQDNTVSTTLSTQTHQHNNINTTPSTHHHQPFTINNSSSTQHHPHITINTSPSTQHHLHYIIKNLLDTFLVVFLVFVLFIPQLVVQRHC